MQTSLTVKDSENVVKVDFLKNVCDGEHQFFLEMKEAYKVYCVKILIFLLN